MYVHIKDLNCISVLFLSDADYVTQSNARPRNKKTREESVNLGGMIKNLHFVSECMCGPLVELCPFS